MKVKGLYVLGPLLAGKVSPGGQLVFFQVQRGFWPRKRVAKKREGWCHAG